MGVSHRPRAPPDATAKRAIVKSALEKHLAKYEANPEAAKLAIHNGESKPNPESLRA